MDKELVKAFVQECKDYRDWQERIKANQIDMDDWFKYSGEVEEYTDEYKEFLKYNGFSWLKAKRHGSILPMSRDRKTYYKQYWHDVVKPKQLLKHLENERNIRYEQNKRRTTEESS